MPVAVLVLALAAYAYVLATASQQVRVWGLALGALACLGLGVYLWNAEPETRLDARRIAPEELTVDQLDLARAGRGAALSGRVLNGSDRFRLREMTLTLRLRDCPDEAAEPAACPTIGEASALARPDAPPGQIRAFSAQFVFPNLPSVAGVLRWDWTITSTRATD